jgi:hypothetical protein
MTLTQAQQPAPTSSVSAGGLNVPPALSPSIDLAVFKDVVAACFGSSHQHHGFARFAGTICHTLSDALLASRQAPPGGGITTDMGMTDYQNRQKEKAAEFFNTIGKLLDRM